MNTDDDIFESVEEQLPSGGSEEFEDATSSFAASANQPAAGETTIYRYGDSPVVSGSAHAVTAAANAASSVHNNDAVPRAGTATNRRAYSARGASAFSQFLAAVTGGQLRIISASDELDGITNSTSVGTTASSNTTTATQPQRLVAAGVGGARDRTYLSSDVSSGRSRRLQARLASFFNSDDDEDDSNSDDVDYVPLRAGRRTLPDVTGSSLAATGSAGKRRKDAGDYSSDEQRIKSPPNTACIMASDFRLQLDARFGRFGGQLRHASLSSTNSLTLQTAKRLPSLLAERECRALTSSEKLQLACQLLPDTKMQLAHLQSGRFFGGVYSDSGDLFVSYSQDQSIRLFDTSQTTAQAHMVRTIRARDVGWSIIDVQIAPDCSNLVYSSWCDAIHMCSLRDIKFSAHDDNDAECDDEGEKGLSKNDRKKRTIRSSNNNSAEPSNLPDTQEALQLEPSYSMSFCVFSMGYAYDAREIIAGSSAGYIYVYDLMRGRRTLCIAGHADDCNAVAFSRTSSDIFFSTGDDGLIKIWDRRALSEAQPLPVGVFAGHQNGCTFLDAHFDGRHVLSNSKDQTIKLWDCRHMASRDAVRETTRAVKSQSWDYRWARGRAGDNQGGLASKTGPLKNDCSLMTYSGAHTLVTTLIRARFSPQHVTGGRYIYCGSGDHDVVIYDALTAKPVKILMHHTELVRDVHWHPHRQEIVSSSWDGDHELWFHRPHSGRHHRNRLYNNTKTSSIFVSDDADDENGGRVESDNNRDGSRSAGDDIEIVTGHPLMRMIEDDNGTTVVHRPVTHCETERRRKRQRLIELGLLDP